MKSTKISHPYHLVVSSPVPLIISILLFDLIIVFILIIYNKLFANYILIYIIINFVIAIYLWEYEIRTEGFFEGLHTKIVSNNLLTGFILFVLSEVAIFASLFFGYFYNSLIPSIDIGNEWPPIGITILNPYAIPLYNTALLYLSGVTITLGQIYLNSRSKLKALNYLYLTIFLGSVFTYVQYIEYYWANFTIADGIYPTTFFILTGFHGVHVIIGTILLIISTIRVNNNLYSYKNPVFYVSSSIYWHFVDYVWLVLYLTLYCWGAGNTFGG